MDFLYLLEKIRNPVFDTFFSLVTHLGEETVFLAAALIVFWCVNKREGYFLLITGLVGTVINQALKLICKIPRPWVKDPSFTIVESARAEATGYSFPSGHTQNVTTTFGVIGKCSKRTPVRIISLVVIVLVAFSRMYLGVHTPADVVVSLAIGAALVIFMHPLFRDQGKFERAMPYIIAASVLISVGLVIYVILMPTEGMDPHNVLSGRENAATILGCTLAFFPVYYVDKKFIRFDTSAKWYAQLLKLAFGLGLVLLIKEGLKAPLGALIGNGYVARAIRYFVVVMFAGTVWPITFKFFGKLGQK